LQSHILPTEDLTGIYRYAVLLTGVPREAQEVVLQVFSDAAEKIHHFRNGKSCEAWLVAKVRNRLLNRGPQSFAASAAETADASASGAPDPAALGFATRFSRLAEPGRSALALLYIGHFSVQEIAQILQLPLEMLAEAVDAARAALCGMETARPAAAQAEEGQP
jgi:DNA-directed RNA polymerase specialized sigma24 family protein